MNAFLDLMIELVNGLYTPLLTALEELEVLTIQIVLGTGYVTLAQVIASFIALFIYFAIAYYPTSFLIKAIKRLFGVMN